MKKTILLLFTLLLSLNIFSQVTIKLDKVNGVYNIPCKVNGIPMNFIFDTGASTVTISLTEAAFLLKQGLLNEEDIKDTVKYQIANGSIDEGTIIILREIEVSGLIINNVTATVVHEQNAPLLLGMSALSKLGKISLENDILVIGEIEYQETEISSDKIVMKNIIIENLSYGTNTVVVKCEFKENYLGIHTLISSKKDVEINQSELNSIDSNEFIDKVNRGFIFTQIKKILIKNGMWIRQLQKFEYEIIAFKIDMFFKNASTTSLYAVSTKQLISILDEFNEDKFNKILVKTKI